MSLTERSLFYLCAAAFAVSFLAALWILNDRLMVTVPSRGGTLREGVVGVPRFINPVLAFSDVDKDLTALTYSGLLKEAPDGALIGDLADNYTVSPDGLVYTFNLRDDASFHDGKPVSANDVVFTIRMALDPQLKSPRRPNWDGISVEKIADRTIKFTLKQPYSPFLRNATMGILPEHIWKSVSVDQFPWSPWNTEPIGSGPYKIAKIKRAAGGGPSEYRLTSFGQYNLGEPYLKTLSINFFANEGEALKALEDRKIDSLSGVSPSKAKLLSESRARVEHTPLPRIFAIFFNQSQATILSDRQVRLALSAAVDRKEIVEKVLHGYGVPITGPIPEGLIKTEATGATSTAANLKKAAAILDQAGWKINPQTGIREKKTKKQTTPLTFSLTTSNVPELREVAGLVAEQWQKAGIKAELKIFESGDLNQNVIRPRKYDALLFGEVVGKDLDVFAFWHSSQRNDPGLNIALYANAKADKLLEQARSTTDTDKRLSLYASFMNEIATDTPAVFLYAPDFIYILPQSVKGADFSDITIPRDRFLNVHKWYVETDQVWKVFAGN